MNQQSHGPEPPHSSSDLYHTDGVSANSEQRKCLHEATNPEQKAFMNSSPSSCCPPSKHHSRHGDPLYRSLLRSYHCGQPSFMEYAEGAHHFHRNQCLFEAENSAAGNCFSQQCVLYTPCRCGSPMLHENNTRKGLSNGHSYYANRALLNEITLYNWYLIRSGDSHSSDIAVGGFLSSRGAEVDRIETTTIVKRLEECKLLTKDGNVVNIAGPIDDYRTVSNGFTLQIVHLFISGFPHIWNLLVGMGLPAKVTGTTSRSCDFGEITFQERLQKETLGQREYRQQISALEGFETDVASYLEGERYCGAQHVIEENLGAEANAKSLDNVFLQDEGFSLLNSENQLKEDQLALHTQAQVQGTGLLNGKDQSIEDRHMSCDPSQERELDEEAAIETNCTEECSEQLEACQSRMRFISNQPVEVIDLAGEQDDVPGVKASVTGTVLGDEKSELFTEKPIENSVQENHISQAFLEATADAGVESDKILSENLEVEPHQSSELSEGELGVAKSNKTSCSPSSKRRKVAFINASDVEGGEPSCMSLGLEAVAKSMEKSCSVFNKNGEEVISSVISTEKQKDVVSKKSTAKQKGKCKRRGRFSILKSKQFAKPKAHSKKRENAVEQRRDFPQKEELGERFQKRSSRIHNKGRIAVLEKSLPSDKAGRDFDCIPVTRMKTRERSLQKSIEEKVMQTGSIVKELHNCFTKSMDLISETGARNVQGDGSLPSRDSRDSQRKGKRGRSRGSGLELQSEALATEEASKVQGDGSLPSRDCRDSQRKRKRGRSRGSGLELQLDTLATEEASKSPEKVETLEPGRASLAGGNSEQKGIGQTHEGSDLSLVMSARKRTKMLPPPLPSPLVSVSKQLVSKAFGLKTSKSGRLLVPPLAHWCGQSLVRDMDGGIIAIEDGSQGTPRETGCFNFKPPMEARAKKLQEWLSSTASKCLNRKLTARRKTREKKSVAR